MSSLDSGPACPASVFLPHLLQGPKRLQTTREKLHRSHFPTSDESPLYGEGRNCRLFFFRKLNYQCEAFAGQGGKRIPRNFGHWSGSSSPPPTWSSCLSGTTMSCWFRAESKTNSGKILFLFQRVSGSDRKHLGSKLASLCCCRIVSSSPRPLCLWMTSGILGLHLCDRRRRERGD